MRTGRPKVELVLTEIEEKQLRSLARRSRTAPQMARRARIVLGCASGLDNKTVARKTRLNPKTVGKWRARFVSQRLEGLSDEPRPGTPRRISDDQIEDVIIRTLESTPKGATHWSTRDMAKAAGLSHMTISRIWKAFGLKPHRTESFKLSPDPLLVEKIRDIIGLYFDPPEHAMVLCVDEKSQIQADDVAPPPTAHSGSPCSAVPSPSLATLRVDRSWSSYSDSLCKSLTDFHHGLLGVDDDPR